MRKSLHTELQINTIHPLSRNDSNVAAPCFTRQDLRDTGYYYFRFATIWAY